jgi:alkylation response protein AidB-like acyl-CoA dehydrogenase
VRRASEVPAGNLVDFRQEARDVLLAVIEATGWDWETGDPQDIPTQGRFYKELYSRGWAALAWPNEFGGAGRTLVEQATFAEESARLRAPGQYNRVALGIVGPTLVHYGTDAQRSQYLGSILAGESIWCQGFSEPNAGSDLAGLRTSAKRQDEEWRFSGQKVWSTLAIEADHCFLLARTGEGRYDGISAFLVNMRQPGITTRPIKQISGESDFCEIFFEDALAADDALLGAVGDGWRIAMGALGYERSIHLTQRQMALEWTLKSVIQNVSESPLSEFFEHDIQEAYLAVESMKSAARQQLREIDAGREPTTDANGTKVLWSETYQLVTRLALDVTAATVGCPKLDYWVNQYYASLASSIYAGTNQIQRNIVAERGLGLPR